MYNRDVKWQNCKLIEQAIQKLINLIAADTWHFSEIKPHINVLYVSQQKSYRH